MTRHKRSTNAGSSKSQSGLGYDPFENLSEDDFKKSARESKLTLVCLADVEEEVIDRLWYGGIPYRT